jgi:hypothetical protein
MECLIDDEYNGEDMTSIEWNREAPERMRCCLEGGGE